MGGILLDFAADVGHKHPKRLGPLHVTVPPDLFVDEAVREHLSGVVHQQLIFNRGQVGFLALHVNAHGGEMRAKNNKEGGAVIGFTLPL